MGFIDVCLCTFYIIEASIVLNREWAELNVAMLLMYSLVCLWATRLTLHIAVRHFTRFRGKLDPRYQEIMSKLGGSSQCMKDFLFFNTVHHGYAFASILNQAPVLYVMRYSKADAQLGAWEYTGFGFFIIGFLFEAIGDYQNHVFKMNPANKGKVMKTGLWRYTRHPNFFGDALLWYGLFIMACGTKGGWVTLFGPLMMHYALVFETGVQLTEKFQQQNPEFRLY